ncbi:hypothetical protein JCM6882_004734 [Rhodosporidiobolus microsporus]
MAVSAFLAHSVRASLDVDSPKPRQFKAPPGPDDAPDAVFRNPLPTNGTAPLLLNVSLPMSTTTWDANITAGIVWDNNPQARGTTGFNLGLQNGTTIPIKANQVLYREPYTFSEPCSSFTLNTTLTMNRTDYLSLNPENGVIPSGSVGTLYIQITHEREYAHGFCSDVVFLDNYTAPSVEGCPAAELSPSSGAPGQLKPVLMGAAGVAMAAVGLVLA